jgi:NADH-quinone oxidoreductase subunit E
MTKFPEGRQASAIIPLLWRAQEQEGWLTRPAIERVAEMLDMAYMRALEVASFYFMFQLQPVGGVAHFQICGTTTCMICGAEDLVGVCREKIAAKPHEISSDGKFSWEEVECLGACANAPMAQVGKDYYEDLTAVRLGEIIDEMAAGEIPAPGPQNGRFAAEPLAGLTSLTAHAAGREALNASVGLASTQSDTLKRIDGTELPLIMPWLNSDDRGSALDPSASARPTTLAKARDGGPDKLTKIKGIGPKLQELLLSMGFFHFDQIASWDKSQVAWVDENLDGFKGRASRDDWVAQAFSLSGSSVGGVK